ncbi:hypothetical protein HanPSC8_Chr17g0783521 [Helianthus annuus]|nr:hypothetical protein HanPSC8_Chr17g0783521 [Helianthus annuus]
MFKKKNKLTQSIVLNNTLPCSKITHNLMLTKKQTNNPTQSLVPKYHITCPK